MNEDALAAGIAMVVKAIEQRMTRVGDEHPPAHASFLVCRKGEFFTCTPCYGMHQPWWVVRLMDGSEGEPVLMDDDDVWVGIERRSDGVERGVRRATGE